MATFAQPSGSAQLSAVQGSPSSQSVAMPPPHAPAVQSSASLQLSPSLQGVASARYASTGQAGARPEQLSATSRSEATGRNSVVPEAKASLGHAGAVPLDPEHASARSQVPAEARQTTSAAR